MMQRYKIEEVLEQTDFVRALARALVADEHTADDVAQQAILAALVNPPLRERSIRAWLYRVIQNLARFSRRSERNRREREIAAAPLGQAPGAAELAAEADVRRIVVGAVRSLEEPYRTAIELRFYAGMPPREIAHQLGLSVETVRTRIRRALAPVREKLDADRGGRREEWLAALAPLAGLKLVPPAGATAATAAAAPAISGPALSGGLIMAASTKAVLVSAVILCSAAVGVCLFNWLGRGDDPHGVINPPAPANESEAAELARHGGRRLETFRDAGGGSAGGAQEEETSRAAVPAGNIVLVLKVRDKVSGEPVRAYHVRASDADDRLAPDVLFERTVSDPEGVCTVALGAGCRCTLLIRSQNYIRERLTGIEVPSTPGRTELTVELDPGVAVSGRVVDGETNTPVAGALVVPEEFDQKWIIRGAGECGPLAWSDEEGRFLLHGLEELETRIATLHPEYAEGCVRVTPSEAGEEEVEIRLQRGFAVFGTVRNDAGEPAAGIEIARWGGETAATACVLSAAGGSYRTWPIAPGAINVSASQPEAPGSRTLDFSPETKVVEITGSDVRVDFGPSGHYVEWSGKLVDPTGLPAADVSVWIALREAYSGRMPPRESRSTRCDSEGRFLFRKLVPGKYGVSLEFPDDNTGYRTEESFESPGRHERDLVLECGAIRGEIIDQDTGTRLHGRRCWASASTPAGVAATQGVVRDGLFCIRAVPPGVYTVSASGSDVAAARVSDVVVESGKITEGVKIPIPAAGWVEVELGGFAREDDVSVLLTATNGPGVAVVRSDASIRRVSLEPGEYECYARLERGGQAVGALTRRLHVYKNETTALRITRQEFEALEKDIAVSGLITFADGRPLADSDVTLESRHRVFGIPKADRLRRARTNPDGAFTAEGLRARDWLVRAYIREGTEELECVLDPLVIAGGAESPCRYRAVVPECRVRGLVRLDPTIVELLRPHTDDVCWATIEELPTGRRSYVSRGSPAPGETGAYSFLFAFVPAGSWQMQILAKGHESPALRTVSLSRGEEKDCGLIPLTPLDGVCLVQASGDGAPTPGDFLFPEVPGLVNTRLTYISDGRYLYTDLPPGRLWVIARCPGYRDTEFSITFNPGVGIQEYRVVMNPTSDK